LPRHALHSTKLAVESEGEWTNPLPVGARVFWRNDLRLILLRTRRERPSASTIPPAKP
jgi:hypothetical protein